MFRKTKFLFLPMSFASSFVNRRHNQELSQKKHDMTNFLHNDIKPPNPPVLKAISKTGFKSQLINEDISY